MNNNEAHNLILTNEELGAIMDALAEKPYKISAPIIGIIQNQLQAEFEEKQRQAEQENQVKEVAKKAQ